MNAPINNRIFEHDYIRNVLGMQIPLNESVDMSVAFKARVLSEQRLLEGWFANFARLGTDMKNTALAIRYIIEDPGRISDFVAEIQKKLEEMVEDILEFVGTVKPALEYIGEKMKPALEFLGMIEQKCRDAVQAIGQQSGWKQAVFAVSTLVGIAFLFNKIMKIGSGVAAASKAFVSAYLTGEAVSPDEDEEDDGEDVEEEEEAPQEEKQNQNNQQKNQKQQTKKKKAKTSGGKTGKKKKKKKPQQEAVDSSLPLLSNALYTDQSLEEIFGLFGGKKKKKKKSLAKRDKERMQKARQADQAVAQGKEASGFLPEDASEELQEAYSTLITAVKEMMKAVGMKVLKGLAVDAMLGAVTGGIAPMLKFLVKSFGGFKFVMKILRQPLRRFAGKMDKKTIDKEMKEAEKGVDDPTEKNENVLRMKVRKILIQNELHG